MENNWLSVLHTCRVLILAPADTAMSGLNDAIADAILNFWDYVSSEVYTQLGLKHKRTHLEEMKS